MKETRYLALIRGINVGGKNIIKMTDLKACFENLGFADVKTYIQSGNVIFQTGEKNRILLSKMIEKRLSERFTAALRIVLLTQDQLQEIISEAPGNFGLEPDKYRYDVIFLMDNLSSGELIKAIRIREGVDIASAGKKALYFSRLISDAGLSYLKYIISMAEYQYITIRNWNTTVKLLALLKSDTR